MKTLQVIAKIKRAAKDAGLNFETYELKRHTGIKVGDTSTTIGRHSETTEQMARVIWKQLESELGKDWWR